MRAVGFAGFSLGLILAFCGCDGDGGSDGGTWIDPTTAVCHLPPGTSKWNKPDFRVIPASEPPVLTTTRPWARNNSMEDMRYP